MFPFKNFHKTKRSYRFGVPTFYNKFHIGVDYIVPVGTKIRAWDDLEVIRAFVGKQGGNTVWCKVIGEVPLIRLLHNKALPKKGKYKEGELICFTGNTGLSTAPHSHIDVSKNGNLELTNTKNFTDPDKYFEKYKPKAKKPAPIVPEPPKVESEVHIPITIVKPAPPIPDAPVVVQEPVKPVTFWELLWFDFKEFLTNFKQR